MRDERRDYGGITLGWAVKSTPLPLKAPANAKPGATAVFGLAVSALLETKTLSVMLTDATSANRPSGQRGGGC